MKDKREWKISDPEPLNPTPDKQLEDAAQYYAVNTDGDFEFARNWKEVREIFKAGARWQAERDRVEIENLKDEALKNFLSGKDAIEEIRAEKEMWGNEFTAVIICKDEIETLKEHKRLLFEENSRLLTEKESGQWDKNEALLEENAKLRAENEKMRAVVEATRNEAHWHQASGVRGDRCGICIALAALDGEAT